MPAGLRLADRLPEPMFTPSTKATEGHDENISYEGAVDLVGKETAQQARDICVEAYRRAAAAAESHGIIVADTKFELGVIDGRLALCDEILTPDSSRFWPADGYEPGQGQPSFDKQIVRDWASSTGWDKRPPAPEIPEEVVARTRAKYIEAYERVTGNAFADWAARTQASGR
jgi:phosphoribosylaminoimidazole-succinocarboxamide synthase